jgi:hypothetical protein
MLGGLAAQLGPNAALTPSALFHANQNPATAAQAQTVLAASLQKLQSNETMSAKEKDAAAAQLGPAADFADGFKSKDMTRAAADARKVADALSPTEAKLGKIKWIDILDLRPMQFDVGMEQVEKKKLALLKMTPGEQRAWLLKHPVPIVVRKNGEQHVHKGGAASAKNRRENRPDDHHHEARAAWEAGIKRIPVVIEEVQTTSKKEKKFWKKMRKGNKVYLKDRWGNAHDESDLPMDVRGLGDNPYRSIAGEVRDQGGYKKNREPFSEFRWAEFFRENLTIHPNDDFEGAVKEAMRLASSKKAKGLPGWLGKKR